ncbi:NAD(P)H-dependent oxidoreductase [Streptomyces sp. NPDC037389]|uniref:flavodoxin family protein n=1 Tax=Streptomyces sp. NPDC037389 TaxID=3155369 RepID=UPI0033FC79D2
MTDADQNVKRSFLFLLGSGREGGNTETLARRAAAQLPSGVRQTWLRLSDHPLPPFEDLRHSADRTFTPPTGNEKLLLDATLDATDLVIASPVYWYSVSAGTKLYLDHWVNWLSIPELRFRDRMRGSTLWAVAASSSDGRTVAEPLLGSLRASAAYMGMRWGGELLGSGTEPGAVLEDAEAVAGAKSLFWPAAPGPRP